MTQTAPDVSRQLRRTKAQLARMVSWSLQPDSLLQVRNLSVSQWTPALHIEHTNRANEAILNAIRTLQEPSAIGKPVSEKAREFLGHGVIERGTRKAPDFVVPQGITLDEIRRDCKALVAGYAALEERLPDMMARGVTADHPVLGPLTADLWLRFVEVHTFHHLQILCELVGANL